MGRKRWTCEVGLEVSLAKRYKREFSRLYVTGFFLTCNGLVCPLTPSMYSESKNSADWDVILLGIAISRSIGETGSGAGNGVSRISDTVDQTVVATK